MARRWAARRLVGVPPVWNAVQTLEEGARELNPAPFLGSKRPATKGRSGKAQP